MGHFTRDCQSGGGNEGMMCKWCGPGNHEDANCPKQKGVNRLDIADSEREVLALTRMQARKLEYPDMATERERFQEATKDIRHSTEERRESTMKTPNKGPVPNIMK